MQDASVTMEVKSMHAAIFCCFSERARAHPGGDRVRKLRRGLGGGAGSEKGGSWKGSSGGSEWSVEEQNWRTAPTIERQASLESRNR